MALVGLVMLTLIYPVGGYLAERNQELLDKLCIDEACIEDPNFMYYHDGGDATVVAFSLFAIGGGLLYVAALLALWYQLIKHNVIFRLKEMFRLKGSKVD